MSTELVPGIHPAQLLEQRDEVAQKVHQALALLMEAETLSARYGFNRHFRDGLYTTHWRQLSALIANGEPRGDGDREAKMEAMLAQHRRVLDTAAWDMLLHASGLRSFMDAAARKEWAEAMKGYEVPALDASSIEATFQSLYTDRQMMVERGVLDVFRRLSWDKKTNLPERFGNKLIVSHFLNHTGGVYEGLGGVEDLYRALCVFDGKPVPDHRASLYMAASIAKRDGGRAIENDYMDLKWFKNGNAHIVFKRHDLIEKLNGVLAKHYPNALPAPRKAA